MRAVGAAQRQVDVAGVALALVVLRHERERLAVLGGDLLGGGLVDGVVVGGDERLGVEEADLVLAEVALALRALDVHAGGVHVVADVAQQRLDPRGADQRVVDVVLVDRGQVAPAAVVRVLVGVVERDELELGAGERHHVHRGDLLELGLQDRARGLRHRCVVEPDQVALHQRGGGQVRQQAEGVPVGDELHVAVALLPRGDRCSRRPCSCRRRRPAGSCSPRCRARARRRGSSGRAAACPAAAPACR